MDPNETLRRLRELTKDTLNGEYAIGDEPAAEIAELFHSLDEWMVRGGYPPTAWIAG